MIEKATTKTPFLLVTILSCCLLGSCRKMEDLEFDSLPSTQQQVDMQELTIPEGFTLSTEKKVSFTISEKVEKNSAKYLIYSIEDGKEKLVASRIANGREIEIATILPDFVQKVKVVRLGSNGSKDEKVLDADNPRFSGSFSNGAGVSGCNEHLYAVNGDKGFYNIDVESGGYGATRLSDLAGGGSIACAVNKDSSVVFYNTGTTLRYYDYDAETFHVLSTGNPFNGSYPRMEYDHITGYLHIGKNEKMYTIDPYTNKTIASYDIEGLQSPVSGGDLAISKDGTMYLCCFSGLYRLSLSGSKAYATRISAENLPFQPTSMAIDRNDRLYLGTNDSKSKLIEMDKVDGAWSVVKTYNHKINDLGSYKCDLNQLTNVDSDGDGVTDQLDDFPNDASAATASYTPSELGWGTLAYEDLWPSRGDYDFNDMVVKYRHVQIANADNEVVRLEAKFQVKAIGASFHNGFGFTMDLNPSYISSVTGSNLTDNLVTLNSKGLESGHSSGSVIIVFDDAFDNLGTNPGGTFVNTLASATEIVAPEMVININFVNPISPNLLGSAPYDPFIFINGDRGRELHLADREPSDLANSNYFGTLHDASNSSTGVYYRTNKNLPWAMNIIHEFRQPLEKNAINKAYNHFNSWATSRGSRYRDWYKDNAGYRNTSRLFIR